MENHYWVQIVSSVPSTELLIQVEFLVTFFLLLFLEQHPAVLKVLLS